MFWHIKSKNPTVSVAKLYAIFKTYKTLNKPILYFLRPDLYGSLCAVLRVWFGMFPVFFVLIFICFIAESLQYGKQSIKKFTKVPVSTTVICLSWWSCSVSEVKRVDLSSDFRCCQDHKKCLEEYTTEGEDSLCSRKHLKYCESKAIDCMYDLDDINAILSDRRNNGGCWWWKLFNY